MGPMAVEYYVANRPTIAGEIKFWTQMVKPKMNVLEIGSGAGHLSLPLAMKRPRSLTLVERDPGMVKQLRRRMKAAKDSCKIRIIQSDFQKRTYPKQDLILFCYDSLPLVFLARERKKVFEVAFRTLRPGGRFAIHFSTPATERRMLRNYRGWKTGTFRAGTEQISYRKIALPAGPHTFTLDLILESMRSGKRESYRFYTAFLHVSAVIAVAAATGFRLVERHADYRPPRKSNAKQAILVFEKPK